MCVRGRFMCIRHTPSDDPLRPPHPQVLTPSQPRRTSVSPVRLSKTAGEPPPFSTLMGQVSQFSQSASQSHRPSQRRPRAVHFRDEEGKERGTVHPEALELARYIGSRDGDPWRPPEEGMDTGSTLERGGTAEMFRKGTGLPMMHFDLPKDWGVERVLASRGEGVGESGGESGGGGGLPRVEARSRWFNAAGRWHWRRCVVLGFEEESGRYLIDWADMEEEGGPDVVELFDRR
eukprot:1187883-Prorocentrum_minimum.AAC.1